MDSMDFQADFPTVKESVFPQRCFRPLHAVKAVGDRRSALVTGILCLFYQAILIGYLHSGDYRIFGDGIDPDLFSLLCFKADLQMSACGSFDFQQRISVAVYLPRALRLEGGVQILNGGVAGQQQLDPVRRLRPQ